MQSNYDPSVENEDALRATHGMDAWDAVKFVGAAAASIPAWMPSLTFAKPTLTTPNDILLMIFLRGGIDGTQLVIPHGHLNYTSTLRPTLYIPPSGAIDLDGKFSLNSAATNLMTPWTAGHLAFVMGAGLLPIDNKNYSHFWGQDLMEKGVEDPSGQTKGWFARYIDTHPDLSLSPFAAYATSDVLPWTIKGSLKSLGIPDPSNYTIGGNPATAAARSAAIANAYAQVNPSDPLRNGVLNSLNTIELMQQVPFSQPSSQYPDTPFGQAMRTTADIIRYQLTQPNPPLNVRGIMHNLGGWDMHANEDTEFGPLAAQLAHALTGFYTDLGILMSSVTVVATSEFGRNNKENGAKGTDHGRGGLMIAMGGNVNGGQVFAETADWGTSSDHWLDTDPEATLPIDYDYRVVYREVLEDRTDADAATLDATFPGYSPPPLTYLGITHP